ncbi:MAG: hypothetical protein HN802_06725 [Candidatus Jacksonbacteria bacterium]|jgi:hypothetical protein|nr:hypothetical protein [Candidatus Jacksonbacteria bacterium]MBT6757045.1 hypothetical protein [Candidatus Jacksonbacteria bacterium]MBT7339358.1 hypothetical protein [Candidatus Jacksonbacteria bacterium]
MATEHLDEERLEEEQPEHHTSAEAAEKFLATLRDAEFDYACRCQS